MRLSLGPHIYDLTTRALVLAVLDGNGDILTQQAAQAIDAGADILEVDTTEAVAALHARFDQPVSILVRDAIDITVAVDAGASLINHRSGALERVATSAALVVTVPACDSGIADALTYLATAAGRAEAAGLDHAQIILDANLDAPRSPAERHALLQLTNRIAWLGRPVMASVEDIAEMSFAVARGARILRVPARCIVQARRVRDTLAAVWEAE